MPTWTSAGNGDWNVGSNWSGGAAPNGTNHNATFNNATNGGFLQVGVLEGTTITIGTLNVNLSGTTDFALGGSLNDSGSGFATLYFNNGSIAGNSIVTINTAVGGGEFEITGFGGLRVDLGPSVTIFDVVNTGTTARINAQIFGNGGLVKEGNGTLILGGSNTSWTGGAYVTDGILQIANGAALGTDVLQLATGGAFRTASSLTVTNSISLLNGAGSLRAAAGTTATYTGNYSNQSNTGAMTIGSAADNGTIIANFANVGSTSGASLNVAGGTLRLENSNTAFNMLRQGGTGLNQIASGATIDTRGFETHINNLDMNGGTIRTSTGVLDLVIDDNTAGTTSQAGTIQGTSGTDTIRVDVNAGFSFSGVTFSNWTAGTDIIAIYGDGDNNGITGSTQVDFIDGGAGNDTIFGNGGLDTIVGGEGNDIIILNAANSGTNVIGGNGTDTLRIISGPVQLDGNSFNTGFEAIELIGGATLDLSNYHYENTFAEGTTIAGLGTLEIDMNYTADVFNGGHMTVLAGSSIATTINGGDNSSSGDKVKGIRGATNTIYGNAGTDNLSGGDIGDIIDGGSEVDKIKGNGGADLLTGGSGADVFKFRELADSGIGISADTITDFLSGTDKINFQRIDANVGLAGDQAFAFAGTGAFAGGGTGSIRYTDLGADLRVEVDVNGDGIADMHVLLQGAGAQTLTAADFVL